MRKPQRGMNKGGWLLLFALLLLSSGCIHTGAAGAGTEMSMLRPTAFESGHAPVNGISMYYEVHGRTDSVPLVLLHGGGATIEATFGKVLPVFAAGRRVIAVEEQGHGRTTDGDAPVTLESSADNVAALLRYLKVDRADIFGSSTGRNDCTKTSGSAGSRGGNAKKVPRSRVLGRE